MQTREAWIQFGSRIITSRPVSSTFPMAPTRLKLGSVSVLTRMIAHASADSSNNVLKSRGQCVAFAERLSRTIGRTLSSRCRNVQMR